MTLIRFVAAGLLALAAASCASPLTRDAAPPETVTPPLRVGVAPHFPPLVFNQQGELAGVEVDMMRRIGREIDRPVRVNVLNWDELADALVAGEVDVIMSGMSITDSRKVRVAFTEPWMRTGLIAMMRQRDADGIQSAADVQAFRGRIGVIAGSTGHDFVRRSCRQAKVIRIATPGDAAVQLQRNIIDMFIHDIPSVLWQVSANEAELAVVMERLSHENIAWAVRLDNTELLKQLNEILARWKADGSLERDILKWVPYYDSIR